MKTVKTISKSYKIEINYIVYEKNDDGILLICTVYGSGKSYKTNISIDFDELDEVLALINSSNQVDLYELISSRLLNSNDFISEVNLTSTFGKSIFISDDRLAA